MLKKLILLALIIVGLFYLYKIYVLKETTPFFEKHESKVNFFGAGTSADELVEEERQKGNW